MSTQSQPIIPVTMPYNNELNGNHHLTNEMHRDADHISSNISQNEVRDKIAYSETRQNIERNADQISTQANANSIAGLLATENTSTETKLAVQNTATATQLGVQNSSTATQLAVQNTATASQLAVQNTATASQLAVQNTSSAIQLGIRDSTAVASAHSAALSVQAERINGLNVVESKTIQVNQGRDLGATQLLQTQQFAALQLQASENKLYLSDKINYSSEKQTEKSNSVMEKLAECCCENKMLHAETKTTFLENELDTLRASSSTVTPA